MNRGQAIADLSIQLTAVTSVERAQEIIQRALRTAGLTNAPIIDEMGMSSLLQDRAAEGGAIQEIAEQVAVNGITATGSIPTDQDAA